jgi:hypothetical protein
MRSMLDLCPSADGTTLRIGRDDLSHVADLTIERIHFAGSTVTVAVAGGVGEVTGG